MKILLTILFLLVSPQVYAALEDGCTKPYNVQYSHKDFNDRKFVNRDPDQFSNTCIKGSNFSQVYRDGDQNVSKRVFPPDAVNIEFISCNLDNVKIKFENGHTAPKQGEFKNRRRRLRMQNDWRLWKIDPDDDDAPTQPLRKARMERRGMNVDPNLLPAQRRTKEEQEPFEELFDTDQEGDDLNEED